MLHLGARSATLLAASGSGQEPTSQPAPDAERPVSWKRLVPNLLSDQASIWSFPARLARGQSPLPAAAVLGVTAGLVALDPAEAAYFHRTPVFQGWNNIFTGHATVVGTIAAPSPPRGPT